MKNNTRDLYIINLFIFVFSILIYLFKSFVYIKYINIFFWLVLFLVLIIRNGFPKDKNYFKRITLRYVIIYGFSYLIVIYLLGLFTGFVVSGYNHSIKGIIINVLGPLALIITQEVCRYLVCKKSSNSKRNIIIFNFLISINIIEMLLTNYTFNGNESIFIFISLYVLPTIASQSLYTYLTYNVSIIPSIILRIGFEVLLYFLPIFPDLGDFINSALGIIFPFMVFTTIRKILKYRDKKTLSFKKFAISATTIPILIFAGILVILVSGIFKYKMIAIASNSMNPIYYRGDAIIYEKMKPKQIKEGDILVFQNGNIIVTHRVTKKECIEGKYYFTTKGDNNNSVDPIITEGKDVYGKVNYIVKYVGYPTLWFQEIFNK